MSNIKKERPKPLADRLRNRRTAAGFVPKPCETATTNNAEMLLTKRIKSWMSFQNLWRTASPSRFRAQTMRIHRQKTAETSPTEPVKNKEQRLPPARKNFAQGKPWKSASHQAKPKQKVLGSAETCLTLLSEALKKEEERPKQTPSQRRTNPKTTHKRNATPPSCWLR